MVSLERGPDSSIQNVKVVELTGIDQRMRSCRTREGFAGIL